MPETVDILSTALEAEAKKFLELVASLENDDLYAFIRQVSAVDRTRSDIPEALKEVVSIARNVRNIEDALEDFYVA